MRTEGTGRILPEPVGAGKGHGEHIVSCLAAGRGRAKPKPQLLAATVDFDHAGAARTSAMTAMLDGLLEPLLDNERIAVAATRTTVARHGAENPRSRVTAKPTCGRTEGP